MLRWFTEWRRGGSRPAFSASQYSPPIAEFGDDAALVVMQGAAPRQLLPTEIVEADLQEWKITMAETLK